MNDERRCPYENIEDCPRVKQTAMPGLLEVAGKIADSDRILSTLDNKGSIAGMVAIKPCCPRMRKK